MKKPDLVRRTLGRLLAPKRGNGMRLKQLLKPIDSLDRPWDSYLLLIDAHPEIHIILDDIMISAVCFDPCVKIEQPINKRSCS